MRITLCLLASACVDGQSSAPAQYLGEPGDAGMTTLYTSLTLDRSTPSGPTPEIDFRARNGGWFTGQDVANVTRARDFVIAGQRPTYACEDAVIANGSTTITSAAQCGFSSAYIDGFITGPGIPDGTKLAAVGSPTSATLSQPATESGTIRAELTRYATANDVVYAKHRGGLSPMIGIGCTPPQGAQRMQVCAADSEATMGGLGVRVGPSQTGPAFSVYNSSGVDKFWIRNTFELQGENGVQLRAANPANELAVQLSSSNGAVRYGFQVIPGSNDMRVRNTNTNANVMIFESDNDVRAMKDVIVDGIVRLGGPNGPMVKSGIGSPDGVVSAPVGSLYTRTDSALGPRLFVREDPAVATAWVAK